ncbi:SMI1 / KNR4 family protein [Planctomycetes bacterium Pan216]|uniref:SMI1 / KNR4 family protein n=1 Tax=Kolteria novifilia TaxID=2527975 RepID=A0A518B023_9BACT|nr:SMI1 / KNR4 family protein [Planctomycetes bacterium Pan216]
MCNDLIERLLSLDLLPIGPPAATGMFQPVKSDAIEYLETKYAAKLPDDYAQFAVEIGVSMFRSFVYASVLDKSIHEISGGRSWVQAELFLGSSPEGVENGSYDIVTTYENYGYRVPPGMLPFAESGNDLILIGMTQGLSGNERGRIYFWDSVEEVPDADDEDDPPQFEDYYDNVYLVANSFREFVESLKCFGEKYPDPD